MAEARALPYAVMIALHPAALIVAPNPAVMIFTILLLTGAIGGVITLAKGRSGWFMIGLLAGGLPWNLTAFLPARPGSLWARRRYSEDRVARARREFPRRSE